MMYTKITNPIVYAFDIETDQYIGKAKFDLTDESEKQLLNLINYRVPVDTLVGLNSDFEPSENYVTIVPNQTYHQKGVMVALLTEESSGRAVPVEMQITYDWRSRTPESTNFITSVDYSNFQITDIKELVH